jgi:hypothetical protein
MGFARLPYGAGLRDPERPLTIKNKKVPFFCKRNQNPGR